MVIMTEKQVLAVVGEYNEFLHLDLTETCACDKDGNKKDGLTTGLNCGINFKVGSYVMYDLPAKICDQITKDQNHIKLGFR